MNPTTDTDVRTYVIILNRRNDADTPRVIEHDPSASLFDQTAPDAAIITTTNPDDWDDLSRPLGMSVRVIRTADPDMALKVGRRQITDWRWGRLS